MTAGAKKKAGKIKSKDNTLIYYEKTEGNANKPTLFFIHGMGGDLDAWQYVRGYFEELGFTTIAVDMRGHGKTGHPHHHKAYSLENLVQDTLDVMDAENPKETILVGHCYGAITGLSLASRYPNRIKGLVAISASYHGPYGTKSKALKMGANFLINVFSQIRIKPIRPGHSNYPPGRVYKEYEWFGLARTIARNSLRSYLLLSKTLVNLNLESELEKINIPTLILTGNKDTIYPHKISLEIHKKIKNSKMEIIEGANHVVVLNNIPEVNSKIHKFINSIYS